MAIFYLEDIVIFLKNMLVMFYVMVNMILNKWLNSYFKILFITTRNKASMNERCLESSIASDMLKWNQEPVWDTHYIFLSYLWKFHPKTTSFSLHPTQAAQEREQAHKGNQLSCARGNKKPEEIKKKGECNKKSTGCGQLGMGSCPPARRAS